MLAGAQSEPKLAPFALAALTMWIERIEVVLERCCSSRHCANFVDVPGMARARAPRSSPGLYDGIAQTAPTGP